MDTRLVRIAPNEVNWLESAWDYAKANPGKTTAGSLMALSMIPLELPVLFTGAVVSGITGLTVGAVANLVRGSETIDEIEIKDAGKFTDLRGNQITNPSVYAHHPDTSRSYILIPASAFHAAIVSEQIADLVAFIRSKVAARTINIYVFSENGTSVAVDVDSVSGTLPIKVHGGSARHHSLELQYDDALSVPASGRLFWLDEFPEMKTAFEGAKRGRVKRSVSVDTTFGLSATVAKLAGIDVNWLGRQRFEIEVIF